MSWALRAGFSIPLRVRCRYPGVKSGLWSQNPGVRCQPAGWRGNINTLWQCLHYGRAVWCGDSSVWCADPSCVTLLALRRPCSPRTPSCWSRTAHVTPAKSLLLQLLLASTQATRSARSRHIHHAGHAQHTPRLPHPCRSSCCLLPRRPSGPRARAAHP